MSTIIVAGASGRQLSSTFAGFSEYDVVAFPDISSFPKSYPGPYEHAMGGDIVSLLELFARRLADTECHERVVELAKTPERWSAGHAVFDEVRRRLLAATEAKDLRKCYQYHFEEQCCKAIYNASGSPAPFDPSSAFFVVPSALGLARALEIPIEAVADVWRGAH